MAKWMRYSLVDDQSSIQLPQFEACDHLHCTAEAHDKQQRHCDLEGARRKLEYFKGKQRGCT